MKLEKISRNLKFLCNSIRGATTRFLSPTRLLTGKIVHLPVSTERKQQNDPLSETQEAQITSNVQEPFWKILKNHSTKRNQKEDSLD